MGPGCRDSLFLNAEKAFKKELKQIAPSLTRLLDIPPLQQSLHGKNAANNLLRRAAASPVHAEASY